MWLLQRALPSHKVLLGLEDSRIRESCFLREIKTEMTQKGKASNRCLCTFTPRGNETGRLSSGAQ